MIKSVLALACTGALFSSGVSAQTSVTLYGTADGDFRVDHTNVGTLKGVGSGGYLASRWGIRGSEDLGNGWKANFVFEQGFNLDDNSVNTGNITPATPTTNISSTGSRMFSNLATVGLSSDPFGNLRFGRDLKSIWVSCLTSDAFRGSYVGQGINVAVNTRVFSKYDNGVFYDSPTFGGLKVAAQIALGESTTNTVPGTPKNAGNKFGGGIFYRTGPLYLTYSYSNDKSGTTSPFISNSVNHLRNNVAGAVYDFGFFKLHGMAFSGKDSLGFNVRSGHIGTSVPFGEWTFMAGYGHLNDLGASNPAAPTVRTNYDGNFYGAAAQYNFSKRTLAYLSAATWKARNRFGGAYGITDSDATIGLFTTTNLVGVNPWSAQIGLAHQF